MPPPPPAQKKATRADIVLSRKPLGKPSKPSKNNASVAPKKANKKKTPETTKQNEERGHSILFAMLRTGLVRPGDVLVFNAFDKTQFVVIEERPSHAERRYQFSAPIGEAPGQVPGRIVELLRMRQANRSQRDKKQRDAGVMLVDVGDGAIVRLTMAFLPAVLFCRWRQNAFLGGLDGQKSNSTLTTADWLDSVGANAE